MGRIIFIVGGARSGKSGFALKRGETMGERRLYIATAQPLDEEMRERIKRHRGQRGDDWDTVEEPIEVAEVIKKKNRHYDVVLLDCLTLWLSNLMHIPSKSEIRNLRSEILNRVDSLITACKESDANIVIVSNEVGLGIVPQNTLARQFRDIAGDMNQIVAEVASEFFFMISGIPMRVK